MYGKGKSSFGLALFKSLTSTQTRILQSCFGTRTKLANQVGYSQEPYVNLLGDLFFNLGSPVRADPSEFLLYGSGLWVRRDLVLSYLRFDSRHVFVGPRENVFEIF